MFQMFFVLPKTIALDPAHSSKPWNHIVSIWNTGQDEVYAIKGMFLENEVLEQKGCLFLCFIYFGVSDVLIWLEGEFWIVLAY